MTICGRLEDRLKAVGTLIGKQKKGNQNKRKNRSSLASSGLEIVFSAFDGYSVSRSWHQSGKISAWVHAKGCRLQLIAVHVKGRKAD